MSLRIDRVAAGDIVSARGESLGAVLSGRAIFDAFLEAPNGPRTQSLSGHVFQRWANPASPTMLPTVISGKLTFTHAGPAGGYHYTQTTNPVTRIGGAFTLSAYSTPFGVAGFVLFQTTPTTIADGVTNLVPATGMHLVVGATTWEILVFDGTNAAPVGITNGTFATALTADDATVHYVDCVLDRANAVAFITLPNGQVVRVAHSSIGRACYFPTWEPYRNSGGGTDSLAKFTAIWAETGDSAALPIVRQAWHRQLETWRRAAQSANNVDNTLTLSASSTTIAGTSLYIRVPPSKQVVATAELFFDMSADGNTFVDFMSGASGLGTARVGTTAANTSGLRTVRRVLDLSSSAVDENIEMHVAAWVHGGAAGVVRNYNNLSGLQRDVASLTVEAVAIPDSLS